jgi:hypothetical protein
LIPFFLHEGFGSFGGGITIKPVVTVAADVNDKAAGLFFFAHLPFVIRFCPIFACLNSILRIIC